MQIKRSRKRLVKYKSRVERNQKCKKKKVEKTTYSLNNIISTVTAKPKLINMENKSVIDIPKYKILDTRFYNLEIWVYVKNK